MVQGGVATIAVDALDREQRAKEVERLPPIEGLASLLVVDSGLPPVQGDEPDAGPSRESVRYPAGDVFLPLIADPKTPRFFASIRYHDTAVGDTTLAAVGFGETFGLWRKPGDRVGEGLQFSVAAGMFAQFDLETPSYSLVNGDFIVGLPLTWKRGAHSARLRLYHQSSHLGDDFLLDTRTDRRNLSFESLELLYSFEARGWRAYGGGEGLLRQEPEDLDSWGAHAGVEWRGKRNLLCLGRGVGGLDLKSWEENDWDVDASLVLGLESGGARPGTRGTRWLLEFYDGHSPYGLFYEQKIQSIGFGIYFGF